MRRSKESRIDAAIGQIEAAGSLDYPAQALGRAIARSGQLAGKWGKKLGNVLHGTWYGHPIHPMLVTIPIGTWTLAFVLDSMATLGIVRDRKTLRAADIALQAGTGAAIAAAAAGMADWQHTDGRDRRLGFIHGLVNSTALGLNLASIRLRRQDRRTTGRLLSAAGWSCMAIGGYLGGHLVYRRRIGADHADRSPVPRDFQPVLPLAELPENQPWRVEIWDEIARQNIGIALVRQGDNVYALGARCSHQGGPLDQGWVLEGTLVCPWHGSRYDLATGQPVNGPSTCPQPRYTARIRNEIVEIRREQEPGDEIVTAEGLARLDLPATDVRATDVPGKKADEVLSEHHQLLRQLFARIIPAGGKNNPPAVHPVLCVRRAGERRRKFEPQHQAAPGCVSVSADWY
jgi:nitrite reductase/ring-hydroxylating ferredoxin subunit/uncharacterized membrane protein